MIAFMVVGLLLTLTFRSEAQGAEANFYVATNGNDAWAGKLSAPNAAGTDGPFATLEQARDALRQLKAAERLKAPVTVMIRGGTYPLSAPLVLAPEDSGTEDCPITYAAYPGETPVVSGGKPITGWQRGEAQLWTVEIPEVKAGEWYFHQLFVNGERRRRARQPNEASYSIVGPVDPEDAYNNPKNRNGFQFEPGDIKSNWTNLDDVEVVVLQFWTEARLRIAQLDEENHIVTFTGGSWRPLTWSHGYYVENLYEGLDEPGEWYLNRQTGILYYWPLPDEDMTQAEVTAPATEQLVRFEGDVDAAKFVQHITLRGLTFYYTSWTLPEQGYAQPTSEVHVGGAIYAKGAHHLSLEENEIAHTGAWGIELARGSQDNHIIGNHIYDLGAGAIRIGETTKAATDLEEACRNVVSDNYIHDGCGVYLGAPGIWIGKNSGNLVAHNEIWGAFEWAIRVGWSHGLSPTRACDNIIEYNHLHHLGESILGTHAAIHTLGLQPGTVVRYNLIHHISGGGCGICLDDGSSQILVENNITYYTKYGFVFNFSSVDNTINNNIFALTTHAVLIRYGDAPRSGFKNSNNSYRNIHYWREGRLFRNKHGWPDYDTVRDYNLYFDPSGRPIEFVNSGFEEFKEKGLDVHSVIANPLFVDPENGDFTLAPESPAFALGFKPIDLSTVGPRAAVRPIPTRDRGQPLAPSVSDSDRGWE